jgi:hypothetical protein
MAIPKPCSLGSTLSRWLRPALPLSSNPNSAMGVRTGQRVAGTAGFQTPKHCRHWLVGTEPIQQPRPPELREALAVPAVQPDYYGSGRCLTMSERGPTMTDSAVHRAVLLVSKNAAQRKHCFASEVP